MQRKEIFNQKSFCLSPCAPIFLFVNRNVEWTEGVNGKTGIGFSSEWADECVHMAFAGNLHGFKEGSLWRSNLGIKAFAKIQACSVWQLICAVAQHCSVTQSCQHACTPVHGAVSGLSALRVCRDGFGILWNGIHCTLQDCFYLHKCEKLCKIHMTQYIIWEAVQLLDWRPFYMYFIHKSWMLSLLSHATVVFLFKVLFLEDKNCV